MYNDHEDHFYVDYLPSHYDEMSAAENWPPRRRGEVSKGDSHAAGREISSRQAPRPYPSDLPGEGKANPAEIILSRHADALPLFCIFLLSVFIMALLGAFALGKLYGEVTSLRYLLDTRRHSGYGSDRTAPNAAAVPRNLGDSSL